jgi:acyl carrier protein
VDNIIIIPERSVAKTTSGKISRQNNKQKYLNNEFTILHQKKNEFEESGTIGDRVVAAFSNLVGFKVNVNDDAEKLGLNSMQLFVLMGKLNKIADRKLDVQQLTRQGITVRDIIDLIKL